MMNYMRDGGFGMWLMLATTVVVFVIAALRPRMARPTVFVAGTLALIVQGIFGLSTGMVAVSHGYQRFPDHAAAIAQGLGELANNGTFCALLASVLGIAALVTGRMAARDAA